MHPDTAILRQPLTKRSAAVAKPSRSRSARAAAGPADTTALRQFCRKSQSVDAPVAVRPSPLRLPHCHSPLTCRTRAMPNEGEPLGLKNTMPPEADTCRTLIAPKLPAAARNFADPHRPLSASTGERDGVRCRTPAKPSGRAQAPDRRRAAAALWRAAKAESPAHFTKRQRE